MDHFTKLDSPTIVSCSAHSSNLPSPNRVLPGVAILLCTYQGQHHLCAQLDSFLAQTHSNWAVWASDDGSTDDTLSILEFYKAGLCNGRLSIVRGPANGFVANFLSLICNHEIEADFYAYSDQDDIWNADKLERALSWLNGIPREIPALYCSRTRLVDENNAGIGYSPLFSNPPCFANALTQNVASGNTMVFNHSARAILREAGETVDVVAHDWWTYLAVSGCGGRVLYDPVPSLRYRQHDGNLIGDKSTWLDRIARFRLMLLGRFRDWNTRNIAALQRISPRISSENRPILEHFVLARQQPLIPRLIGLRRSGVFRQTLAGNLGLIAATILGRI